MFVSAPEPPGGASALPVAALTSFIEFSYERSFQPENGEINFKTQQSLNPTAAEIMKRHAVIWCVTTAAVGVITVCELRVELTHTLIDKNQ